MFKRKLFAALLIFAMTAVAPSSRNDLSVRDPRRASDDVVTTYTFGNSNTTNAQCKAMNDPKVGQFVNRSPATLSNCDQIGKGLQANAETIVGTTPKSFTGIKNITLVISTASSGRGSWYTHIVDGQNDNDNAENFVGSFTASVVVAADTSQVLFASDDPKNGYVRIRVTATTGSIYLTKVIITTAPVKTNSELAAETLNRISGVLPTNGQTNVRQQDITEKLPTTASEASLTQSVITYDVDGPATIEEDGTVRLDSYGTSGAVSIQGQIVNNKDNTTPHTLPFSFTFEIELALSSDRIILDIISFEDAMQLLLSSVIVLSQINLPTSLPNGTTVSWSSLSENVVIENGVATITPATAESLSQVKVEAILTNTINGNEEYTYKDDGDEEALIFKIPYHNPDATYDIEFVGYVGELVLEGEIISADYFTDISSGSIDLPTPNGIKYGKKFLGWSTVGSAPIIDSFFVLADTIFTAVYENNYTADVIESNIKLDMSASIKDITVSPVLKYEKAGTSTEYVEASEATNATNLNVSNDIFKITGEKNSASNAPGLNQANSRIHFYADKNNQKGSAMNIEMRETTKKITNISILFEQTVAKTSIKDASGYELYGKTPEASKTISIGIENGTSKITIQNINETNVQVHVKRITITYSAGKETSYSPAPGTGLRFGVTFDNVDADFTDAGTLVMPTGDESLVNTYLTNINDADGTELQQNGILGSSSILNIKAENRSYNNDTLEFAGVIKMSKSSQYSVSLTAVCYYILDGQIYFSQETTTSLKLLATDYIANAVAMNLNQAQIASLEKIAQ